MSGKISRIFMSKEIIEFKFCSLNSMKVCLQTFLSKFNPCYDIASKMKSTALLGTGSWLK